MPNYYRNRLTVLHDSPERVEEVMTAIRSEEREVIDFNRIIPMPEPLRGKDHDMLGEYEAKWLIEQAFPRTLCEYDRWQALRQHEELKPEVRGRAEAEWRQMLRNIADYGYASFLYWAIDNWGTKWNSMGDDKEMRREGNTIYFETANNYCRPIVEALSRRFPDVGFAYAAADEDKGRGPSRECSATVRSTAPRRPSRRRPSTSAGSCSPRARRIGTSCLTERGT